MSCVVCVLGAWCVHVLLLCPVLCVCVVRAGGVVPVGAVVVPPPTVSARDGRATPTAPASAAAVFDEV